MHKCVIVAAPSQHGSCTPGTCPAAAVVFLPPSLQNTHDRSHAMAIECSLAVFCFYHCSCLHCCSQVLPRYGGPPSRTARSRCKIPAPTRNWHACTDAILNQHDTSQHPLELPASLLSSSCPAHCWLHPHSQDMQPAGLQPTPASQQASNGHLTHLDVPVPIQHQTSTPENQRRLFHSAPVSAACQPRAHKARP